MGWLKNLIPRAVVLLMASAIPFPHQAVAQMRGDVELLKIAATAMRENRERIRTWRGEASVVDSIRVGDSIREETWSSATFAYDRMQNTTRWNWTYGKGYTHDGDKKTARPDRQLGFDNAMIKDGMLYRLKSIKGTPDTRDGSLDIGLYGDLGGVRRGVRSRDFDPVYFLGCNKGDEMLMFRYGHSSLKPWSCASVSRKQDLVVFEVDTPVVLNRYTYDLSRGANLVAYEAVEKSQKDDSPVGSAHHAIEYAMQSGVWVPTTAKFEDTQYGTATTTIREVKWTESVVNEPLPADAFSLAKLGARRGDMLIDTRSNTRSRIQDEHLPPLTVDAPARSRTFLIWGSVALLLVAILLVVVRLRRRASKHSQGIV